MTATGKRLINQHLEDFPDKDNRWLARKLFRDYPEHFASVEDIRTAIRYRKGAQGKKKLSQVQDTSFLPRHKLAEKYNLPVAIKPMAFSYKKVETERCLLMSDIHFPFHSEESLGLAIEYGIKKNIDTVILNGDILDAHALSKFSIENIEATLELELEYTIQFLESLKDIFKDCRIIYKFGNHEKRFQRYINDNAPALRGVTKCTLEGFLELDKLGVEYVPEWQVIDLGGLTVLHGHEYGGVFRTAKALYNKTLDNSVCGHGHTIDSDANTSIKDDQKGTWLMGCLCDKRMPYHPYNKWENGFGYYHKYDDNLWSYKNKRIIQGRAI